MGSLGADVESSVDADVSLPEASVLDVVVVPQPTKQETRPAITAVPAMPKLLRLIIVFIFVPFSDALMATSSGCGSVLPPARV